MKRNLIILTILVGVYFLPGHVFAQAQTHDSETGGVFDVEADGTVKVDGLVFKNISEYLHSDYFITSGKRCGTDAKRQYYKGIPQGSTADCSLSKTVIRSEYWPSGTLIIPVVFHIIHKTDGTGNITDQQVQDQVEIMNEDFGALAGSLGEEGYNTKIQFQLVKITRTANNTWFQDDQEYQYKNALGWDQDRYFNVYTNTAGGYLGYSYLPQDNPGKVYDGVVMLYDAVGGRDNGYSPYDQGRTLVHETGHYLGLLHTFEGYGCYSGFTAGDLIDDTNPENVDHYGCTQTYSCGTADPIHNYMNYTDDICMYEFTDEQANRLVCTLKNYRPLLYQISQPTITVTSPNGGESWAAGSAHNITWTSSGTVGNVKIEYTTNNGSSWSTVTSSTANDGSYSWTVPNTASTQCKVRVQEASDGQPSDTSNAVFSITGGGGSPSLSLNRTQLYFAELTSGTRTGYQQVWINNPGTGTLTWSVADNAAWLTCSPTSGTNAGYIDVSVNAGGLAAGTYTGTITVTAAGAANSPRVVTVTLTVKSYTQDQLPFGEFSTPIDGTTARGSIPVTGWVLDDVEVQEVKIYMGGSYIGDAIFAEGARPDLELAYPGYPKNHQAGWGYMMLTNFLPDGAYWISAQAKDNTGHIVDLGAKYLVIDNAHAVKPFGAIDTPAQSAGASGKTYRNIGWALTPLPNQIPINGSTISVYVDGKNLGHPVYNIYRSDVATLFPGYANSNGSMAYFDIDTTVYTNGIHTIFWVASDNAGNADGIGSRYFIVKNSTSREPAASDAALVVPGMADLLKTRRVNSNPVRIDKGYDNSETIELCPDNNGIISIEIRELEPMEIDLGSPGWRGFQEIGERYRALPIGSTLEMEAGKFYWIPGPGFLGDYSLLFINSETDTTRRIHIRILPR